MCVVPRDRTKQVFKILTEGSSKAPRRAVAVANYFTARAPPPKDIMAFGSVLQLTQHNIGEDGRGSEECIVIALCRRYYSPNQSDHVQ